jgi:hypothetical protein
MTAEATPEPARYRDLFLSVPEADPPGQSQAAPDEGEAAMGRLRTPFDVGPVDAAEPRG